MSEEAGPVAVATATAPPTSPPPRPVDLILARAHLRLGSLALARAELEGFANAGLLDLPGQVDLAEVRWRTGDLAGAGEAAAAALAAGEEEPMALAIAAEAAAALGRPSEARRLANQALQRSSAPIDELFAGMPRSAVWPADAAEPPPTPGTLFHQEPAPQPTLRAGDTDPDVVAARASTAADRRERAAGSQTPGFWDADTGADLAAAELPDPVAELDAGRAALVAGSIDEAALRLGLVLRLAPALAPAVLDATEGQSSPLISIVRGDAYRLVGFDLEARRAFAAAAWSGARDRRGRGAARIERREPAVPPRSDDEDEDGEDADGEDPPTPAGQLPLGQPGEDPPVPFDSRTPADA
jgi:tetratricopeptide (TPR) repeat protein